MTFSAFELLAGLSLDLLIGDPRWLPHPVRGIGWLARQVERMFRATRLPLRLSGILFWLIVVGLTALIVWLTLPWATIYWIYALIAIRSLDGETHEVIRRLDRGDLEAARAQLATVVGRDTAHLDEPEIVRAVIETMSENLSDGIIAPLFFLIVGGPVAMAAYKAINTLDSMVGYRNERYAEFGWASARMDDVANFVPARLTAILVWLSAAALWMNVPRSVRTTLRDAASQPSPNAGYPQAAFAGAIGVQLGGTNRYAGTDVVKAPMGDPLTPLNRGAWEYARGLLFASTLLMILLVILVTGW